ncbi:MAG: PEP-CTERM sorting domain-containing protein [Chthoniobacter sp.]
MTFADSSAHLALEIGRLSAYTHNAGDGTAGGDLSDHLATTGPLTLNGADLRLSLLTTHRLHPGGRRPSSSSPSTVAARSTGRSPPSIGIATDLRKAPSSSSTRNRYEITYLANFSGNSFTGGHDIALLAVVPEPGSMISLLGGLGCLLGLHRLRGVRS